MLDQRQSDSPSKLSPSPGWMLKRRDLVPLREKADIHSMDFELRLVARHLTLFPIFFQSHTTGDTGTVPLIRCLGNLFFLVGLLLG